MSLLGLFLLALSPHPSAAPAPPPAAPVLLQSDEGDDSPSAEIGEEIDRSVHWLREHQDPGTGSYGGVWPTILALRAFAEGPRAYRTSDGPFVTRALGWIVKQQREDGSWSDPEAPDVTPQQATFAALLALGYFQDAPIGDALNRAQAFLTRSSSGAPDLEREAPEGGPQAEAERLLAARNPDFSWGEGDGQRLRTAANLVELNEIYHMLQRKEAKQAHAETKEVHPLPPFGPSDRKEVYDALDRGAAFLLTQAQADGLWGFQGRADPGITAMVCGALLSTPHPLRDEVKQAAYHALDWLKSLQRPDGSIQQGQLANYITSATIMAMVRAGRPEDQEAIAHGRDYLQKLQADEGEGYSESDPYYGGVGYGDDERPDLSNLQMALEALSEAGVKKGDETFKKALVFLQRCQNRSESNDLVLSRDGVTYASGNDGGAGYAPGDSKAGYVELSDGRRVPRSYGSMTYALLKGYLFAGLPKDDPRVVAAWEWLRKHYTLDVNPGFESSSDPSAPYQGLYYYLTTMARTLDLYGDETVVDAEGGEHPWRTEMLGRITAMQRQDGSWVNQNAARWFEGDPALATAYAMTTLAVAVPNDAMGKLRRKLAEDPIIPRKQ